MSIICPAFNNDHYKKFTFPAGELHLQLSDKVLNNNRGSMIDVEFNFYNSGDIFELLLLTHTLRENQIDVGNLILPYMPFGQADRVNEPGECFSLRLFCDLINNVIKPVCVTVYDPHSDVTPALLRNCNIVPQWRILEPIIRSIRYENNWDDLILISPDAGAAKKIYKLALLLDNVAVVECSKVRDTSTGKILKTEVYTSDFCGSPCIICDDQCVGGRTFIEIAKVLRERNAGPIILVTTNGIYSQGMEPFEGLIDQIYNRLGRVK